MPDMKTTILALAAVSICTPSVAAKLPAGAKPMSPSRIRSIYSGKTAHWKISTVYFAPNGRIKGYMNHKRVVLGGAWSVSGNRACMHTNWSKPKTGEHGKGGTDCWDWYTKGGKKWTLWSVHYDHSKAKPSDYYSGEQRKLRRGDGVSAKLAKLGS